ncbi:hypothetical protein [Clostridium botulinum]|uniref:hypothetical protein n=1 Tax=Clostridium botulinum TaxID=1491 RepID=UPI001E456005|nr:hypothetical protein [Clostridium botulinum]MCD3223958.1 hypothetical protein [Clostridium botulinum C/D]
MGEELKGILKMGVLIDEDGSSLDELANAVGDITVKKNDNTIKIEGLYKKLIGLAEQAKELNFSAEDVREQIGTLESQFRNLRTTMIKGSKQYKDMQREISRAYCYDCVKAYLKLHKANAYFKYEIPITLQDNEILVCVGKFIFSVSFDDKERCLTVSDYFYRIQDSNGKMEFKKINSKLDINSLIISDAIKFMNSSFINMNITN